jgi:hypothetical protein
LASVAALVAIVSTATTTIVPTSTPTSSSVVITSTSSSTSPIVEAATAATASTVSAAAAIALVLLSDGFGLTRAEGWRGHDETLKQNRLVGVLHAKVWHFVVYSVQLLVY